MSENKQHEFDIGEIAHVRVSGEPVVVLRTPWWLDQYYVTRRFVPSKEGNYYETEWFRPFELESEEDHTRRRGSETARLAEMLKDQGIAIIEPALKRKGENLN